MGTLLSRLAALVAGALVCAILHGQESEALDPGLESGSAPGIGVLDIAGLQRIPLRDPVEFLASRAESPDSLARQGLLDNFRPLRDADINQGISDQPFWLRVRLRNASTEPIDWVLNGETTYLDFMHVFLMDGAAMRDIVLSDREPFAARPFRYRKLGLRHQTAAASHTDLYLLVGFVPGKADALTLDFDLWEAETFREAQALENLLFGAFYGSQLTLMAIALMLCFLLRRRAYFFYAQFLASTILLWLALNGFGHQYLWPEATRWHNEGFHLIFLFFCLSALLFSREFLATAEHFPRIDRLLQTLSALAVIGVILRLAGVYEAVLYLGAAMMTSLALLLPMVGALAWRRGMEQAFWFMFAWLIHGAGLLIGLLSAYTELLHWGMWPLVYSQIAATLENALLLFATARRVIALDRERRHALVLANTDPLTGLGNRRMLSRHYQVLRERFQHNGRPVFLILIDIDNFKHINDKYGHEAGDRVLVELARMLIELSRSGDACVRYGGEEFAILLQAEDEGAALRVAERIRCRFETSVTRHGDHEIRHTLSIGLTTVFDADRELDEREMINQADQALYRSKAAGRNLTVAYG